MCERRFIPGPIRQEIGADGSVVLVRESIEVTYQPSNWPISAYPTDDKLISLGYTESQCSNCDETKLCQFVPDPYIDEICPDEPNKPSSWCYDCWDDRKAQV